MRDSTERPENLERTKRRRSVIECGRETTRDNSIRNEKEKDSHRHITQTTGKTFEGEHLKELIHEPSVHCWIGELVQ